MPRRKNQKVDKIEKSNYGMRDYIAKEFFANYWDKAKNKIKNWKFNSF